MPSPIMMIASTPPGLFLARLWHTAMIGSWCKMGWLVTPQRKPWHISVSMSQVSRIGRQDLQTSIQLRISGVSSNGGSRNSVLIPVSELLRWCFKSGSPRVISYWLSHPFNAISSAGHRGRQWGTYTVLMNRGNKHVNPTEFVKIDQKSVPIYKNRHLKIFPSAP
jgi:hypothetical protein